MPIPSPAAPWLTAAATAFMESPVNDLHLPDRHEPAFGPPLVGFAAGDDPMWEELKEHVGPYHWTPTEAFALAYPGEAVDAQELSVMSWVVPQTEATRRDHRKTRELTSERWARARIFGEEYVNNGLRRHMLEVLRSRGVQAVAPALLDAFKTLPSEKFVLASTWSERHAAFVAGLGTFGLCDGLITPVGKSVRAGSVVFRLRVPPSERPYIHHHEYCLFYTANTCGACVQRCPAGALSAAGHDKKACRAYLHTMTAPFVKESWHFDGYGCGLCQVGIPCEKGIPPRSGKGEGTPL